MREGEGGRGKGGGGRREGEKGRGWWRGGGCFDITYVITSGRTNPSFASQMKYPLCFL